MFKLINPSSTKANRDQRMEREKTDSIDAYAIADLLIRGEYYDIAKEDNRFNIIRAYVRELDRLVKEMVRIKNQIHTHTDELYPGLESEGNAFLGKQLWIKVFEGFTESKDASEIKHRRMAKATRYRGI